jgi:hypothetical protein
MGIMSTRFRQQMAAELEAKEAEEADPAYRFNNASDAFERSAGTHKAKFLADVPRDEGEKVHKAMLRVFHREMGIA